MKEIFVLGAGASKAAGGIPLGKELGWKYLTPQHWDDYPNDKKIEFITFLVKNFPKKFDMELEKINSYSDLYFPPSISKDFYIDELLRKIKDKNDINSKKMIKTLISRHIIESYSESETNLYRKFLSNLKYCDDEVVIISFNFDTLLNHGNLGDNVGITYPIDFYSLQNNNTKYGAYDINIKCFKLHGSLDWGICLKCKKIVLLSWSLNNYSYNSVQCKNCKGKLEPFIFVPHEEITDKRIKKLWETAGNELGEAEKITFIGYSFPSYDEKAFDLFHDNSSNKAAIKIIDYKSSKQSENIVKKRCEEVFGNTNIDYNFNGFEKYVETM